MGKFKRSIAGLLAVLLGTTAIPIDVLGATAIDLIEDITAEISDGDVNADGLTNLDDVEAIKKLLGSTAGIISSSGHSSYNVYKDDVIDVKDLIAAKQLADGGTPKSPENPSSGETIRLDVTDAECCPGEQVKVDVNIVDWDQDVNAIEICLDFDSNLSLADISCTGDYQSIVEGNELKIFGFSTMTDVYRGTVATLTFDVPDTAYGDYDVKVTSCALYNDSFQTFSPTTEVGLIAADVTERPLYLTPSYVNSKSLRLSWSMPYCSGTLEGFIVYRDGIEIARTSEAWYYDEDLINGTKYNYSVQAYGADNYLSAKSKVITAIPQNPVISAVTFPDNAAVIGGKSTYVKCSLEKTTDSSEYSLTYLNLQGEKQTIFSGSCLAFSTVDIKWNIKDVPSGDYDLTFSVTDRDGASSEKTVRVTVDTTPPEQVFGFEVFDGEEQMKLTWGIASEAKVTGYNIYRRTESSNYVLLSYVDGRDILEYTDKSLNEGDIYFYMMCAVDKFGQEGIYSDEKSAAVKGDETSPEVTLFLPEIGNVLHQFVTITVKADDNIGVGSIEGFISTDDGETWELLFKGKGASVSYRFDTTAYTSSSVKVKAVAYDYAGNVSEDLVHIYAIDNTGPAKVEEIQSVAVTNVTATISWNDVPDNDFSYFKVKYGKSDETEFKTVNVSTTLGVNLTGLIPDTEYTVSVVAVDIYGNVGEYSEPFVFTTASDTMAPVIVSIKPGPNYFNSEIPLSVTAQDDFNITSVTIQTSLSCEDNAEWENTAVINNTSTGTVFVASYNLDLIPYSDGTIYVRAFAKDSAGNIGEPSAVYEYIVDKTIPEAPISLSASSDANAIQLLWKVYENKFDSVAFSLYRSTEENGDYVQILEKTNILNYYDRTAEPETEYFYKLTAIDAAGNESEMSAPVSAILAKDEEIPEIISVSPSDGEVVSSACNKISVLASDNVKLSSVTMEYRISDTDEYTVFSKTSNINNYYIVAEGTLPNTALKGENVQVRISAIDAAGLSANSKELTYTVNNSGTVINKLNVEQLEEYISITWTAEENELSTGYYLYKKVNTGNWQKIGSVYAHTANENGYSFTDYETNTAGTVVYKLEAYSSNGIKTEKQSNAIQIYTNPEAFLECEIVQQQNVEYIYDASACKDYYGITSVTIDYGDGTIETAYSAVEAVFVHKYTELGNYNVKLTCTNEQGLISNLSKKVEVIERTLIGESTVSIKTTDGKPASGINVYVDLGTDRQKKLKTDESGNVTFKTAAGIHTIGVFGDGYLPAERDCTILSGSGNKFDFTVVAEDIVTADFEVERMTLDEIKAAGIDVSAPENQHIVKVQLDVNYEINNESSANLTYYVNNSGSVVGGGGGFGGGFGGGSGTGGSYGGSGSGTITKPVYISVNEETQEVDTAIFLSVPISASFLKEFFHAKLTIINNADEQYIISDNEVQLNLPSGLTLMNTENSDDATVGFDSIAGKSSKEIDWIIRGDEAGSYKISASYHGVLERFNEEINAVFTNEEPIEVYGESAISVDINVPESLLCNQFIFEVAITNNSPVDIYCPSTNIGAVITSAFGAKGSASPQIYQRRIMKAGKYVKIINGSDNFAVLEPGYTYSVVYKVPDVFKSGDEAEFNSSKLDVISSSVKLMSNSKIPVSLNIVSMLDSVVIEDIKQLPDYDPATQFIIMVSGSDTGSIVNGTSVVFNGEKKTISSSGYCVFDIPESGTGELTVSANGYETYTDSSYSVSSSGVNMISLQSTGTTGNPDSSATTATSGGTIQTVTTTTEFGSKVDPKDFLGNVKLGNDISVKVPSDVPGIGGSEFKIGGLSLDFSTYEITEDGHLFLYSNMNQSSGKTAAQKISALDSAIKNIRDKKSIKPESKLGAPELKFEAQAYLHAYVGQGKTMDELLESGEFLLEGYIGVIAGVKLKYSVQTVAFTIPIYIELGGEASVGASAMFRAQYKDNEYNFSGRLDVDISVKIFAYIGAGVSVLSVGGYGELNLKTNVSLLPELELKKITLSGTLAIKAILGPFEAKIPILSNDSDPWVLYDNKTTLSSTSNKHSVFSPEDIYNAENYTAIQRTYLNSTNNWNGSAEDNAVTDDSLLPLSTLISDSGYNTSQKLISNGKDLVMVFLDDNTGRSVYNNSCLKYSVFDSENSTWSEPIQIDSNNTFDYAPELYSDGSDIYVIYQDAASELNGENVEMYEWSTIQNIAVSKFDSETQSFDEPVLLTNDNDIYDSQPVISSANGCISAVWISNENSDSFGVNNTNRLMYSELSENSWSEPIVLTENLPAVTELSAGEFNGKFFAAFITDLDNNLATLDDRRLCAVDTSKNVYEVEDGEVSSVKFCVSPEDGTQKMYWFQDGAIVCTDNLTVCSSVMNFYPTSLTNEFDIIGDKLVWIANDSVDSANIYGCRYDSNSKTWGGPVAFSNQNEYIENLTVEEYGGEIFIAANKNNVELTDEDVITINSLVWGKITNTDNLTLNGAYYNSYELTNDGILSLELDVSNSGTNPVSGLTVEVINESGELVKSCQVDTAIASGEESEINVEMEVGNNFNYGKYQVKITSANAADLELSDNTVWIDISLVYTLGDVNNNGKIDAIDASMILSEYVASATNNTTAFTEEQKKAADVNLDGNIDAIDASKILAYYSATATGKVPSFN